MDYLVLMQIINLSCLNKLKMKEIFESFKVSSRTMNTKLYNQITMYSKIHYYCLLYSLTQRSRSSVYSN